MPRDPRIWRETIMHREVLAGNEDAWRTWFDEYFDRLFAYILWRCGGRRDIAEETTQETWLTAVRKIRSFEPTRGDFFGWLRAIAGNILRNHLRKLARRPLSATPYDDQSHTTARTTEHNHALERSGELVALALGDLPERYEEVLRAKYFEHKSVAEIASASGDTPKAVESVLSRARQAFRQALERREQEHERRE